MYPNNHGVPSRSVSGTDAHNQFIMHAEENSRRNYAMVSAAIPGRTLLKLNTGGTALEPIAAPTDDVFAVLVEPKPAGVTSFYAFAGGVHVNAYMLNYAAMGTVDIDDVPVLNLNLAGVQIVTPIFSGAD